MAEAEGLMLKTDPKFGREIIVHPKPPVDEGAELLNEMDECVFTTPCISLVRMTMSNARMVSSNIFKRHLLVHNCSFVCVFVCLCILRCPDTKYFSRRRTSLCRP